MKQPCLTKGGWGGHRSQNIPPKAGGIANRTLMVNEYAIELFLNSQNIPPKAGGIANRTLMVNEYAIELFLNPLGSTIHDIDTTSRISVYPLISRFPELVVDFYAIAKFSCVQLRWCPLGNRLPNLYRDISLSIDIKIII